MEGRDTDEFYFKTSIEREDIYMGCSVDTHKLEISVQSLGEETLLETQCGKCVCVCVCQTNLCEAIRPQQECLK